MDLDEILDDWIKIDKNKIHTCYGFIDKWFEPVLHKAISLENEINELDARICREASESQTVD